MITLCFAGTDGGGGGGRGCGANSVDSFLEMGWFVVVNFGAVTPPNTS